MNILHTRRPKQNRTVAPMRMTREVFEAIRTTIGSLPPETGGMLGGDIESGLITNFHFDDDATRTGVTYSPNHQRLTRVLQEQWNPAGIRLLGFVHSHPRGCRRPSLGDERYAERILIVSADLDRLLLPIVISEHDGSNFELLAYAAIQTKTGLGVSAVPMVVHDSPARVRTESRVPSATFDRVRTAYDLEHLQRVRVVAIGCGGSAEFLEMLARAGIGQFVLIDPDVVTDSNLATQQTYRRDLGRMKVEAIAERIRDINPHAWVKPLYVWSNQLNDEHFQRLLRADRQEYSLMTLVCGMTDSFAAQARTNRLALQFSVPSLCAQVYHEGRGAEVSFTHPDTTGACHRCVLRSRYEAYLRASFQNDVSSTGTPICSTSRLNSTKFMIAMALLHHNTNHPRWGTLLRRIGNRNLIQLRMDPDADLPVFSRVFAGADTQRLLCDETVWLPQLPDHPRNGFPTCPECLGTGDLRRVAGTFLDTRKMSV